MVEYKWKLLSITTIGAYMSSLDGSIVNIALSSISADPMLKIELFSKNRVFASANLTALFYFIALSGIAFLFAIYLQTFLQFPPSVAGLIIMPTPIMMAIMSPLSGRLSDKIGTRILTFLGMGIIAAAITFMILVIWFLLKTKNRMVYILNIYHHIFFKTILFYTSSIYKIN